MAKGTNKVPDFRTSTATAKPEETPNASTVDLGHDFVKAGETAKVGHGVGVSIS